MTPLFSHHPYYAAGPKRLGLATTGYLYHFKGNSLIQKYNGKMTALRPNAE